MNASLVSSQVGRQLLSNSMSDFPKQTGAAHPSFSGNKQANKHLVFVDLSFKSSVFVCV